MTYIGMRDLKENMGKFVDLIKSGENITLKYRGKPLAVVKAIGNKPSKKSTLEKKLQELEEKGIIRRGKGKFKKHKSISLPGESLSDIVIKYRE